LHDNVEIVLIVIIFSCVGLYILSFIIEKVYNFLSKLDNSFYIYKPEPPKKEKPKEKIKQKPVEKKKEPEFDVKDFLNDDFWNLE